MSEQPDTEFTQQDADAAVENLIGLWKSGGTLAQAMGITAQECEAMYAHGHSLYAQGKYNDAFKIFAQLVSYDHMDSRYQLALASAMQITRRYEEALQQYVVVTVMRVDDPIPVFHSAECLLALGRPQEARESLELIIESMCKPGEHDAVKARSEALLKAINAKTQEK
ncbi:SycD/LcrH family type III secretion system chaperone [Castellaniella sp.]|uniref:SycD/LcrH family type III secretion system chaperone n=1 Tax=Castellaniella sp. TaxID=1955812 RepID=UPI002AFF3AA4|nr:SycD/LcrH family type III secretion system chaperone [Castellaniella sp.]